MQTKKQKGGCQPENREPRLNGGEFRKIQRLWEEKIPERTEGQGRMSKNGKTLRASK